MAPHKELHIPSLDGIRGLAALTVFVSHALYRDLVPGGYGVTVFFFLSGYLITTLLRTEHERSGQIRLGRFYLRRVYRIFPPMYIVLTGSVLLGLSNVLPDEMKLDAVLAQYAHLTNYYYIFFGQDNFAPATSVMWSLAVEEHFYLLFPLLIALLFRRCSPRRTAAILLAVCFAVFAWRCYLVLGVGMGHSYTYYATDTRLDSILFGCIMGVWCNPALDRDRIRLGRNAWIVLMALSVALLLFTFLNRSPVFRETARYSLQGLALFSLFFGAVRYHHWPIFSWLESRPMRALGLISYTFYLTHVPCLLLLRLYLDVGKPLLALLAFIATVAVSTLMYLLVERHMSALRRRLHESPKREPAARATKISDAISTR